MRYLHLLLALLFCLFAYWQANDPDWRQWVAAYGIVAYVAVRAFFGGLRPIVPLLPALLLFGWWCSYLPAFVDWLGAGAPSIAEEMKAEAPHVELTREFFGLLICWVTLGVYAWLAWRGLQNRRAYSPGEVGTLDR